MKRLVLFILIALAFIYCKYSIADKSDESNEPGNRGPDRKLRRNKAKNFTKKKFDNMLINRWLKKCECYYMKTRTKVSTPSSVNALRINGLI